jgi:hypothetical protein
MKRTIALLLVLAGCAETVDPMPYLTPAQRACLAQVEAAVPLAPGQSASLFVSQSGVFTGAVLENGFSKYVLDDGPYNTCIAQSASAAAAAGMTQVAPGVFLDAQDLALWNSMTPAQRQKGLAFIANGGTLAGSVGANL